MTEVMPETPMKIQEEEIKVQGIDPRIPLEEILL